jgi:exopolyphosphatase/pppGpp-phosphohydrolase
MCFNCGCERPTDNMGSNDNITTETFEKAAKASEQTLEEAMTETLHLIQKELSAMGAELEAEEA